MKKFVKGLATCLLSAATLASLVACGEEGEGGSSKKTYEIAMVTDVGQLKDGGFNEFTYQGVVNYAEKHNKAYNYYAPANGADATDADRIAAMELAIENGAKIIVLPGYLQAGALETVAKANPEVKFVFVDGWNMGINNITAICYKEEESGFLAGYATAKDGYTKFGGTFGGGATNPACNRYAYGYVQGINAAAKELNLTADVVISFKYGETFQDSAELQSQMSGWYDNGTEIIFSCGGAMYKSVLAAAATATGTAKMIGVDNDQAWVSPIVVTTAKKGLTESVEKALDQYYNGKWDSELADVLQNLGAADNCTGLPTATESWRFSKFTVAEYEELFNKIAAGQYTIDNVVDGCDQQAFWDNFSNVNVTLDK